MGCIIVLVWLTVWCLIWGKICEIVGKDKDIDGFWWGFFLWFIGLLVVLFAKEKTPKENNKYENLLKLSYLKEMGAITDKEFEIEKSKYINKENIQEDSKEDIEEYEYICPICKKGVKYGQEKCLKCGQKLKFPEAKEDEEIEYTCPTCGEVVTKDQKFCTNCGQEIYFEDLEENNEEDDEEIEYICPTCGETIDKGQKYCGNCGQELEFDD